MDIIFLWNQSLNNGQSNGVILSGKYEISFDLAKRSLAIKRNQEYVRNFWGQNIQDCFAIVGENGAGKTMLVNNIYKRILPINLRLVPIIFLKIVKWHISIMH